MALTLRDCAKTGNGRTRWMDTDFTAVKHAKSKDVAVLDRAGANNLGKVAQANAEKCTGLATFEGFNTFRLLFAKILITDCLQCLFPACVVVARIIFPTKGRLIRELFLLDEVLRPQFSSIHTKLDSQHLNHPFDEIGCLGHAERTAICNAARCLVGIDTIHNQIGCRDIIGPGADVHKACRKLCRVRTGIERTVIGRRMTMQAGNLAVLGG